MQELQRQFPFLDRDLVYDMLREHDYNYDATLECITKMQNEKMPFNRLPPSSSSLPSRSFTTSDESNDTSQRTRWTQYQATGVLDLHDLRADDALRLLQRIEETLSGEAGPHTSQSIKIIAGPAKDSIGEGEVDETRSVILTYLQQRKFR